MEQQALGWSIEFGANHFLVSRAIQRSVPILIEGFNLASASKLLNEKYLVQKIKAILPTCVGNYNCEDYAHYSPMDGRIIFGAQAIDMTDAAKYIIRSSGLSSHILNFSA